MSNKNSKKSTNSSSFQINDEHCFSGLGFTAKVMQDAMDAYARKKKSYTEWLYNDSIPIFIDTNVLLNVYYSPVPLRVNLSRFLKDNKDRLYITSQVESEFMRHRLQFIDTYKNNLTQAATKFRDSCKEFKTDYCAIFKKLKDASVHKDFVDSLPQTDSLLTEVEAIVNANGILGEQYQALITKIEETKSKFEEEYHTLYEKVNIEYNDPILKAISQLNILEPLSQKEYDFTKTLYERLLESYNKDSDSLASYLRFPGSGEKKNPEIKKEPWGDLVIYHQMLVFMKNNHKDVIFLTNDKSKLDWMKKGGEPYSYYIADAYKNTGQILFIISADEFLPNDYSSADETLVDPDSIGIVNSHLFGEPLTDSLLSASQEVSTYKEITSEQFISELKKYSRWAEKFGGDYISLSYFIYVVLGQRGYRYSKSFEMLDTLKDHKVEIYEKDRDGNKMKCIKLKE